jgi:hypothetical protein
MASGAFAGAHAAGGRKGRTTGTDGAATVADTPAS